MFTNVSPIHITVNPGLPDEFAIGREHQLNDAVLTLRDLMVDHNNENSSLPYDKSFGGLEASLKLSISEVSLSIFSKLTNPAEKRAARLDYADLTALKTVKNRVLIRPYDGFALTLNTDDWFTFLYASFEVTASLNFGKSSQTGYEVMLTGFTHPTLGYKLIRGSLDDFVLEPVNQPPIVTLSLENTEAITEGQPVKLKATASDVDGFISSVEFYQSANKIGEVMSVIGQSSSTFSFEAFLVAGSYTLTAVAIDNNGAKTTSNQVNVTVSPRRQPLYNLVGVSLFE